MTKSTEVAVATKDESQLPAYLQNYGKVTNEDNFDSSDVVLPRVKLLQGISGEVETFDDAKAGRFWHTGLDVSLGESFRFVVADRRKKFLLSAPIEDGQGVLARADDAKTWDRLGSWSVKIKGVKQPVTWEITDLDVAKSGLADWGTYNPGDEDSPPAATLFYDYLVILPDFPELGPAVLSLARSQIRTAKKGLNDKIKLHATNGRPMQALIFEAASKTDVADGQEFKNFVFRSAGFVQDEAMFQQALDLRGALANIVIAQEDAIDEASKPTDDGEGSF
jgi:hypothetical protein